jgi:hypothetical protein
MQFLYCMMGDQPHVYNSHLIPHSQCEKCTPWVHGPTPIVGPCTQSVHLTPGMSYELAVKHNNEGLLNSLKTSFLILVTCGV